MSEIQGGRWDGFLRRLFNVKGPAIAPAVGPEIQPIVLAQPEIPDLQWLRREVMFWGHQSGTAAAANFSYVQLHNASLETLITVQLVTAHGSAGNAQYDLRLANTQIGTGNVTIGGRDTRAGLALTGGKQAGQISFGHAGAISGTLVQQKAVNLAYQSTVFEGPFVLAPSTGIIIWHNTSNSAIRVGFQWTERQAEPGELS